MSISRFILYPSALQISLLPEGKNTQTVKQDTNPLVTQGNHKPRKP